MPALVDLKVLDAILEGRGLYFPQGEHPLTEDCLQPDSKCQGPLRHTNVHVLLLNSELMPSRNLLKVLRAAQTITCADGGANRLAQRLSEFDLPTINDVLYVQNTNRRKPCLIVGDLDSYNHQPSHPGAPNMAALGFEIVHIVDENTTDFYKARTELEMRGHIQEGDVLIVDGAFGGRFDQVIALLCMIYKHRYPAKIPEKWGTFGAGATNIDYTTILIGNESACCLLPPGGAIIRPPTQTATNVCGLLPFVPAASVSTKGLRWNLENDPMAIDGICSSSNEVVDEVVEVTSDVPIVWYSFLKEFKLI
eukprot:Protomagalhaensia_wolfi_Nauph_80__260@NODE_1147_length_1697_cov_191_285887_g747_i1_p1_GENE_NODE_1147_length_1697_cov_191_285887_g747_i1NODE_1147_length_1697_cov_191_285887_g747_i1_p1_ORF_typecomplete_len308_score37_28TPK_catalytic/PF04263_16/1_3e18TPK_B1_binding/PF04265_14/3_2e16NTP_transf_4/PF13562_6/0_21_NODE_1147_length_1697_cov_191_285887_g747_i16421565